MARRWFAAICWGTVFLLSGCQPSRDTGREGSPPGPAPAPSTAGPGNRAEGKPKHGVLGDSPERFAECYGKAAEVTDHPDLKGTKVHTFRTDRLTIKAAVADGRCGDLQYAANAGMKLAPELVEELLQANTPPGMGWQKLEVGDTANNPKWVCRGTGKDGAEVSRFAQRPREELFVADLLFKEKYKK